MMEPEGMPREYIKCRAELISPGTDWELSWSHSKLKGLGSDQGWAIPGFGQLYYTNTILEETITILYNTYTNTIPIFSEGLFMHTCILNGTKPCITKMEIKNAAKAG